MCFMAALMMSTFGAAPVHASNAAEQSSSSGFVSGQWRIMALQTVVGEEVPEAGLDTSDQGSWAVIVADVTNTGATGPFDPAMLQLGTTSGSPLSMTNGVAADATSSVLASQTLKFDGVAPDGGFTVAENGTTRVAIAVPVAAETSSAEALVLRLNDQVMDISNTRVDALAVAELPALVPEMKLEVADISNAVGGGKIDVALRSGGNETVQMDSVVSPKADAGIKSSCYSGEFATQVSNLTGGTVWIEEVQDTGESLVWFNDPANANFGLLNAHLVAGGFAGVDEGSSSPYASWLSAVEEYAQSQDTGLWSLCKNAQGAWINQPAPTPVPTQSPEQVRAQYQWIDARDLVIRPDSFMLKSIAISGSVFNIQTQGNQTIMQIWVDGGNYDAVIVYYEGDTTGIYEGTWITVYGKGAGTLDITNAYGATITQPLVRADLLDH